jgi:hypothetical protein
MVLDVAETMFGVFGFTRHHIEVKKKPRNYLEELKNERAQEAVTELSSFMKWD